MGKKLKGISLLLFSICCAIGFSSSVSAETLEMTSDMTKTQVQSAIDSATDELIINGNGHSIIGEIAVNNGIDITIRNVTIDGLINPEVEVEEDRIYDDNLLSLNDAGKVVIDNVTFENYSGKGIYVESLENLEVTNSSFDAAYTEYIDDNDYTGNPEADLIYRSASGIDINLGNGGKTIDVESITIKNNTFKNVVVKEAEQATSTAGAIKIKVKDATNLVGIGAIRIEGNTFENNERDLVLGTNDPTSGTEASATADLDILLVNNSKMNVGNFSTAARAEEVLEGNYKLNYTDNKKYELDDNLYYIVDEDNIDAFTDEEMAAVLADTDVAGIAVTYQGVSFAISKETLLDEDLGASLDDFDIVPSEETTIEALKQYMGEDVMFYTVSGIDLLDDGMSIDISDLGEEFVGTLYLYYYDETNGLQLVSNPNNASLTFDKNGTYVLSATNLIPSTPSEETPSEEVPEVPQTFDALGVYAGIGLVSLAGIAGAVIYLKRRNA